VSAACFGQLFSRGAGFGRADSTKRLIRSQIVRDGMMYLFPRPDTTAPILWLSCMHAALQWLGNWLISKLFAVSLASPGISLTVSLLLEQLIPQRECNLDSHATRLTQSFSPIRQLVCHNCTCPTEPILPIGTQARGHFTQRGSAAHILAVSTPPRTPSSCRVSMTCV